MTCRCSACIVYSRCQTCSPISCSGRWPGGPPVACRQRPGPSTIFCLYASCVLPHNPVGPVLVCCCLLSLAPPDPPVPWFLSTPQPSPPRCLAQPLMRVGPSVLDESVGQLPSPLPCLLYAFQILNGPPRGSLLNVCNTFAVPTMSGQEFEARHCAGNHENSNEALGWRLAEGDAGRFTSIVTAAAGTHGTRQWESEQGSR